MFLSDVDIIKAVKADEIKLEGFDEKRVQPASYDILLGNKFMVPEPERDQVIDPAKGDAPHYRHYILEPDGYFVLHPGVSVLAQSHELFGSDKYLIQLSGKSSLARIGLIVHNTAGIINPGHFLNVVLEMHNLSHVPIILRPRMPIAQLLFAELSSPTKKDYKDTGRYVSENWESYKPPKKT